MPIYEPDLSYEDMEKAVDRFICAECGNDLNIVWGGYYGYNCHVLRCAENFNHNGLKPRGRDPELLEIAHKLYGKELPMETKALMKLDHDQMLARIDKARFPSDLTKQDRQLMATISIEYGLDPLFGELMIYQGKPYVTIDARRRKAQETGNMAGINSRPANKEERAERKVAEGDYLFVCQVWVKGMEHPFEGWGKVREAEIKGSEYLPIVKDPAGMAEKRAEAQALRRAFHIPLPSAEEIGEVVEGEFEEIPPEEEHETEESKTEEKPKAKPKAPKPPIAKNPEAEAEAEENNTELMSLSINNLGEFFSACHKHFGMNQSDVLKELGGITKEQIADVQDAWRQIVEAKT